MLGQDTDPDGEWDPQSDTVDRNTNLKVGRRGKHVDECIGDILHLHAWYLLEELAGCLLTLTTVHNEICLHQSRTDGLQGKERNRSAIEPDVLIWSVVLHNLNVLRD